MQAVSQGEYPGQSTITFLPMIDMNPTDMSCVYTTLKFVTTEAMRHDSKPVLTFDQPLWWKAQMIVQNEPDGSDLKSLVLRLGGFHIEMSFLGSIGRLMSGSGLRQVLEIVYAPNSVGHMLAGKAVARALRGHFLVDAALNAMITAKAFGMTLPASVAADSQENCPSEDDAVSVGIADEEIARDSPGEEIKDSSQDAFDVPDLSEALLYFTSALDGKNQDSSCTKEVMDRVQQKLDALKTELAVYRTSRLWLQYKKMLDILRQFIRAERTGNWHLHLRSLHDMLPYFAASGHNLYTKSVHLYLQQMQVLQLSHPDVYECFCNGHHIIRRSDRYWAGLSPDLVIEQMLMRSVKSTGGLTRGRGMGESQRTQWLLSMPACAEMNSAMQEVTGLKYCSSDQHKEATESRQSRDEKDTCSIMAYLSARDPFDTDSSLRNIATGVTCDTSVNMDTACEAGSKILQTMVGSFVSEYTFKRRDQVITMDSKQLPRVDGESVPIDPQLLFQRLVTAARGNPDHMQYMFRYELSGHPSAIFEPSGLLRQAQKSVLAHAMWTSVRGNEMPVSQLDGNAVHVLDGGSLLHRLPWPRGSTFSGLCTMYTDFVGKYYTNSIVVFDGYGSGPSTKDMAHLRRTGGVMGTAVTFTQDMTVSSKKEEFLANPVNKQRFIIMLSDKLQSQGHRIIHSDGDADLLIVQTAVRSAETLPTVVIGEDTDLLVLLCHHASPTSNSITFRSDARSKSKKMKTWHIQWLQQAIGMEICKLLLFLHAVTGCDTTSRLFGIGKATAMKRLIEDREFQEHAAVFYNNKASVEEILQAGEHAVVSLYNGRLHDTLDVLRYKRFCEKVSVSVTFVQVHTLPPTTAAAKYHSMRVYLQVQQWLDLDCGLNPEEWGWYLLQNRLHPFQTDFPPAPEALLLSIRCSCKTDCDSKRCTCKKHGLSCSATCGQCRGVSCANSTAPFLSDNTEEISDMTDSI